MLSDIPCVVCNIHLTKYAYKINQKIIAVEAFAFISCIFIYHTTRKLTGSGAMKADRILHSLLTASRLHTHQTSLIALFFNNLSVCGAHYTFALLCRRSP